MKRLSVKRVERATETGRYGDGQGLYLVVKSARNRQWVFRYERVVRDAAGAAVLKPSGRPKTKEHWLNLGPTHTYDLEEARELARGMRKSLREGADPATARAAERVAKQAQRECDAAPAASLTFRQAAEAFFASKSLQWKNEKHREQFTSSLETYVYPLIGSLPVERVDTPLVLCVLDQHVETASGKQRFWLAKPETASRVRRRLEWVLSWATVSEHRSGENPARWRGHLDQVLPARGDVAKTRNHPALPYAQLPAFMTALRERNSVSARALEFCILTAARTGEVIGARWAEIDLETNVWSVPAERMKAGKHKKGQPHRVPLSSDALEVLRALPREGEYVFPGGRQGKPLSNMAMNMVIERMNKPTLCGSTSMATLWFRTASGARSGIGRRPRRATSAKRSNWRCRTSSAERRRGPIGATTCWPSG